MSFIVISWNSCHAVYIQFKRHNITFHVFNITSSYTSHIITYHITMYHIINISIYHISCTITYFISYHNIYVSVIHISYHNHIIS